MLKTFLRQATVFRSFSRSFRLRTLSNMSDRHLGQGESLPPLASNKLRLYSMYFCPYAQRARLVLAAKNIDHETVNVNLVKKPEWFKERTPVGKAPVTELNDKVVYDSMVVSEYLDEAYPENPLYPKDPYVKARQKLLIADFDRKVTDPYYAYVVSKYQNQEAMNSMYDGMIRLEEYLKSSGNYFGGEDKPAMVDYMIWPWFERTLMFKLSGKGVPKDRYPLLNAWMERMLQDAAVKSIFTTPENHLKFLVGYTDGKPDYDFLLG